MNEKEVFKIIKARPADSHKGNYGMLNIIAGSRFYRGAAALNVMSALRCGAGIVCLCAIEPVAAAVAAKISECTFIPLEETAGGTISGANIAALSEKIAYGSYCLVGCGMVCCEDTARITEAVLSGGIPAVVDADGLNSLAAYGKTDMLNKSGTARIITPHIGEMSRLCGLSTASIKAEPDRTAADFAREYNCVVVLKDHITRVASPDGRIYVNHTGNAGLARGGSGDVLAGMIASFVMQGIEAYDAAVCAVYLHGLSADLCASRLSQYGMLPSDILDDLCAVFLRNGR